MNRKCQSNVTSAIGTRDDKQPVAQHEALSPLNWWGQHAPSKIPSFAFTSALDTHVRIVIPKAWRAVKVT